MAKSVANKIVNKIVKDLTDRRGLRQEWESIDKDIQKEIIDTWVKIVETTLEKAEPKIRI